jgi:cytochrome c oxidase assembly factor CtaG
MPQRPGRTRSKHFGDFISAAAARQTVRRAYTRKVPSRRRILIGLAFVLVVAAVVPPLSTESSRLLVAHMSQHLVVGDLAPLLLALAISGGVLGRPAVALVAWAASRAVWHYPELFDAAARNPWLHVLEHACLLAGGFALWAAVLRAASTAARIGLVVFFQLGGMALGLILLWAGSPLYARYAHSTIGGLTDQRAAGAVMMAEGTLLTLGLLTWLLVGLLRDDAAAPAPVR